MTDSGLLRILDGGSKNAIWQSPPAHGTLAPNATASLQLLSGSTSKCLNAKAKLYSPNAAYALSITAGALLQLQAAAGGSAVIWSAAASSTGAPPYQACVSEQGQLQLLGSTPGALWASAPAAPGQYGPFTAMLNGSVVEVGAVHAGRRRGGLLCRAVACFAVPGKGLLCWPGCGVLCLVC